MAPSEPDFLCLGVGGTVGEAWTSGLLAGLEDVTGWDLRAARGVVGTSAGSIVAAALAGGHRPRRPPGAAHLPDEEHTEEAYEAEAATGAPADLAGAEATVRAAAAALLPRFGALAGPLALLAPLALGGSALAGATLRRAVLAQLPRGTRSLAGFAATLDALGSRWDGRLRIVAVDLATGRRVVFGARDAPPASVRDAVLASCAVPTVFEPIRIGDADYVDGGVWSPTNLDVLPLERGHRVLLTNPTGFLPSPWGQLSAAAAGLEAAAARSRGVQVDVVAPDAAAANRMGRDLMAGGRSAEGLEAGYRQGRALARRLG